MEGNNARQYNTIYKRLPHQLLIFFNKKEPLDPLTHKNNPFNYYTLFITYSVISIQKYIYDLGQRASSCWLFKTLTGWMSRRPELVEIKHMGDVTTSKFN